MKKIYTFILTGAAILALAACNKDLQIEDNSQINGPVYETLSVKVGSEATTKVTLDGTNDSKSVFEDGDQIAVWTTKNSGEFQDCTVSSGQITVDLTGGATREKYAVYYNGATTTPTFDGTTLTITLPDTYDYDDVADDKNPVPMVAVNDASDATNDLVFYAVCGLARITLTGIPATADKLHLEFSHKVTGEFTVTDPGTTTPSITGAISSSAVTINLIPGTDYTGAVINIPVPLRDGGGDAYAHISARIGTSTSELVFKNISSWMPARAKGKKFTVNFTPSIYSMTFTKGNLYSDGGTLKIASNWYSNIYTDNTSYEEATYSASNRSHFNFNETAALMNSTGSTHSAAPDPGTFIWTTATTNVGSFEDNYVFINYQSYRVPTQAEWEAVTTGTSRPGAYLSSDGGSTYTDGWKFVKVLVSGMGSDGTSSSNGTAYAANSDYQAGLLLFPDNVEITGTFAKLGTQNARAAAYNTTNITKENLNVLITDGCAFLPAVGCWKDTSFELVGTTGAYWSCTKYNADKGYGLTFNNSGLVPSYKLDKSVFFSSVRLVQDLQ